MLGDSSKLGGATENFYKQPKRVSAAAVGQTHKIYDSEFPHKHMSISPNQDHCNTTHQTNRANCASKNGLIWHLGSYWFVML